MSFEGDCCLSIFGAVYATGALVFPPNARVLEIGCGEADWMTPMLEVRPDLQIIGIDWRPTRLPGVVLRGDVLATEFASDTFDAIVGISSIEHVGLGHYDADPLDVDGDLHCATSVARWLKPGGWFYADVPASKDYTVHGTEYRSYNDDTLKSRLARDLTLQQTWYATWAGHLVPEPDFSEPRLMNYVAIHATKDDPNA